jgi:FixJ family two-component response regulator
VVDTDTTIFVVDDDDLVRDALRALLKSAGFDVKVFDSAQAFLNSGHQQRKGLLVLDVQMPGINGLELQRHLADSGAAIPIIFISAHEDVRAHKKAMEEGALAFLQKPLDERILFDAIECAPGQI